MSGRGLLPQLTPKEVMLALVLATVLHLVQGQLNPAFTPSPANPGGNSSNTGTNVFYFASNSDCNGPIRELFSASATIKGSDASSKLLGPTTCTIRLRSTGQYDSTVLDIEVKSMNIQDCTTQVSIYDGDGAQQLLMNYDCRSSQNGNRKLFMTSGNTASFMMSRPNVNNVNFDIEIVVSPVRGSLTPGLDDNSGVYGYFDKFPQLAIVGIIGAFYAIILVICTVIIFYCRRKHFGLNKTWETHQLATIQTGTTLSTSNVWSVPMKGRASQFSTGVTSTIPKRNTTAQEDDSSVYYNDDVFQKRRLMNDERNARSRYVSSNASFTNEEPDQSKEKINPVVNKKKSKRPPSYSEVVSDQSSYHSSDGSGTESSDNKHSASSEEDESERSWSSKSDTPSDTESEGEGRRTRRRARHEKKHAKSAPKARLRGSDNGSGSSRPSQPQQPLPHMQPQQPLPHMQQAPYGAYHPTHFVPMMAGPPQFQAVPMVAPNPGMTYQPQAAAVPQVQPTEPPVYSYLVRRGYTPQEPHNRSTANSQTGHRLGGRQVEDPELRLDSGVEYMRR